MTKSQLIDAIAQRSPAVPRLQVEAIVNAVFESMIDALLDGDRIELRGFGSIGVKVRPGRSGRNPKTGEKVEVPPRRTVFFTCGKELRERINKGVVLSAIEREPASAPPREPEARRAERPALVEERPSLA